MSRRDAKPSGRLAVCLWIQLGPAEAESPIRFGHPSPDAVGFADVECVAQAFVPNRATPAEFLRLPLPADSRCSAFAVRPEEEIRPGGSAERAGLPVPQIGVGRQQTNGECQRWHGIVVSEA